MKFKIILFFILGFFIFKSLSYTHAERRHLAMEIDDDMPDTTRKVNMDSLREARAHAADSMREARQHIADSSKAARQKVTDSMAAARKHVLDSTTAIRKYRDSKHYKDSVTRARTAKTNALKAQRQSHMDSLADARKAMTDSLTAARKSKTDSIKTIQKRRSDSLARIKKYKTSKRYADSVEIVRHERTDSIAAAQKASRDKLAAIRKHSLDSAKVARKHVADSVKLVRTKHTDSLKTAQKARTDSLAKAKKLKENLAKENQKKKENDKKLKLEIKMKQKHEAWTNKQMLKKRWSPYRRLTQNSFTHYNYYYNAKKKMDEALVNMTRTRKENYDSLIGLYPFDPNRDSTLLSSDMDTIIRKISVGIQIHDPRVKWSNDLYLLLGEAYYYRGQYENAATSFRFIIAKDEEEKKKQAAQNGYGRNKSAPSILEDEKKSKLDFLKHKSVHNEAILWLARTYTEAHQVENAQSILSLLESDAKLPEDLRGRLAIEKAFAYLTDGNNKDATLQLAKAIDDNNLPDWLRMRAAFILGQLQQNMGEYNQAAGSFEHVLAYYPKIEMDFYARKYVAYNKLQGGANIDEATRPLKRVLTDGKYVNYYDQVYFVLGKLAEKAKENGQAITYFTKSTTTPKATRKQKALSYAALGDVYYETANYPEAKSAYDSAAKYSSAAGKDKTVVAALQKNKGLEEVAGPSKVIHDQDSLLALAAMSRKEQQSVVRRYLRDLEKKKEDSISNAENTGVTAATPEPDAEKDATNWYFSNPSLMQQGSADFKRKWGNRPLTDNWRRAAGATYAAGSSQDDDGADLMADNDNGLPTEESLLAKIPNTTQQKDLAIKLEQRAYMLLAKAYMKQLEDYNMAIHTLDTLDTRYPAHTHKEEELYLRYQIALKQNQLDKAKMYSDELLSKFPNSEYAGSVRPRHSEAKQEDMIAGQTVSVYYEQTYELAQQHQYTEALMRINAAKKQFSNPTYEKRFQVLEASALAGSGDFDLADTMISRFIHKYPSDTLTAWATTVKNYIKEVRNGGKPSWYNDKPVVTNKPEVPTKKAAPPPPPPSMTEPAAVSDAPASYMYYADTPHYCIIILPGIDSRTSGLKKAVKELNASKYSNNNLEMLFDLYNIEQGVLLVKNFKNAGEAKNYMNDLLASDAMNGYNPGELQVMLITAKNYKKLFADKDVAPYASFYSSHYK